MYGCLQKGAAGNLHTLVSKVLNSRVGHYDHTNRPSINAKFIAARSRSPSSPSIVEAVTSLAFKGAAFFTLSNKAIFTDAGK